MSVQGSSSMANESVTVSEAETGDMQEDIEKKELEPIPEKGGDECTSSSGKGEVIANPTGDSSQDDKDEVTQM